jgi:hypothetical protein
MAEAFISLRMAYEESLDGAAADAGIHHTLVSASDKIESD